VIDQGAPTVKREPQDTTVSLEILSRILDNLA
jgi:hypothetical protein